MSLNGFGPGNVYAAASSWKRLVNAGRDARMQVGHDRYMEVSFESLINHTRETIERVCEYIEEPFSEAVLRPTQIQKDEASLRYGNLSDRYNSMSEADPAYLGAWRTAMSVRDRIILESVAGDLLQEFGYETEGYNRHIGAPEKLMWRAHDLFSFVAKQLGRKRKSLWLPDVLLMRWAAVRPGLNINRVLKRIVGKLGE
jgi:hypothetical protein